MGGEIEQHTEEVGWLGWLHHMWDEVGPQLVTGAATIVGLALAAFITAWAKKKYFPKP